MENPPPERVSTPRRARARSRPVASALAALALGVASVSCSSGPEAAAPTSSARASVSVSTTGSGASAVVTVPGTHPAAGGARALLNGFGEVTITVVDDHGVTHTWCLMLADTEPLRARGLMAVADPSLGGYDGMLFQFDGDTTNGFWMKDTVLPLSIAWIRADGSTVSTTDMTPCPASARTCPTYPSGGPYRIAIEVPQGELARLGIGDGSSVHVGAHGCAAPAGTDPRGTAP